MNDQSKNNPASSTKTTLSYKDAGVDIAAGNALIDRIKPAVARTKRPGQLGGLGGFGALFELPLDRYKAPILVSGTDGVGTKLRLAMDIGKHDTIGIDLVAMCVNDILVQGAEPLFFLDYYASGKLDLDIATDVINGIAKGCEIAGAALVGGETAEMPGMYSEGDYDLAGFCVGVVEKSKIIDGSKVKQGDTLIALASSGPHSNGYSLIRKVLEITQADLKQDLDGRPLGEQLLTPTTIYVKSMLSLFNEIDVHAISHITGGGLLENLPRVLPTGLQANLKKNSWTMPTIFQWLQEQGNIAQSEMYRTFNCGIGLIICVDNKDTEKALQHLNAIGEQAWEIGSVQSGDTDTVIIA